MTRAPKVVVVTPAYTAGRPLRMTRSRRFDRLGGRSTRLR